MRFSSKQFSYDPDFKTFNAEMSTLQFEPSRDLAQVYPDACDEGFEMVSHKTGNVVWFVYTHARFDDEGDLMWLEFVADPVRNKELNGVKALIFND